MGDKRTATKVLAGNSEENRQIGILRSMKNAVFWGVALCGFCVNRSFRGTWFTQDLHGATSQKKAFFIVTALKTS
jgi:hypothetical protein